MLRWLAIAFCLTGAPAVALDKAGCEAWRDGLVEQNALRLAAERTSLALALAELTLGEKPLAVARGEVDAMREHLEGDGFAASLEAWRRVCLGE